MFSYEIQSTKTVLYLSLSAYFTHSYTGTIRAVNSNLTDLIQHSKSKINTRMQNTKNHTHSYLI